jgi:hypothetical protein
MILEIFLALLYFILILSDVVLTIYLGVAINRLVLKRYLTTQQRDNKHLSVNQELFTNRIGN